MGNFTAGGVELVAKNAGKFMADMKAADKASQQFGDSMGDAGKASEKAAKDFKDTGAAMSQLSNVMLASGAVLTGIATKTVLTAARTEELGVVLHRVGQNIGMTADQMDAYDAGVQSMGITTQASRQAIIQMVQAQIDLSHATDLARLAQDAAVIAQMDSSEAFEMLITTVQRGSLVMARSLGLTVSWQDAYKRLADQLGKNVNDLTTQEKMTARLNEVMRAGAQISGTYEAAMGTAGKQMRSMSRYVQELQNEFGQALLPVMSKVVEGTTDLLKWMRALPQPVKETAATMTALGGALLTVVGAAIKLGPKLAGLASGLSGIGIGILGPVGAVAGLVALGIHLANVEKGHQKEAAAILDASTSYRNYIYLLEEAGLETYAMTESLYNTAKAAEDAGRALDSEALVKARERVGLYVEEWDKFLKSMPTFLAAQDDATTAQELWEDQLKQSLKGMTDMQLSVAANKDEVRRWALEVGMGSVEAAKFSREVATLAQETIKARKEADNYTQLETERAKRVTESKKATEELSTGLSEAAVQSAALALQTDIVTQGMANQRITSEDLKAAYDALAAAISNASSMYAGFVGTLANGLIELRNLDATATQSAANYEQALRDLNTEAGQEYGEIRDKFENSLPEFTTVQERMGMAGDAWDEWRLRLMDIMQNGVQSPFYAMLEEMGYQKPPDVGIQEWAAGLKTAFESGDLQDLINTDAAVWQEHATSVKAAQDQETAAVNAGISARKAALEAARQEELAAEQAARERSVIELGLGLAEQSGKLQEWSQSRFGEALSPMADSANEVLALLDSGMLDIDNSLGTLLQNMTTGITESLDATGGQVETTQATLSQLAQGTWKPDFEAAAQETFDLKKYMPEETIAGVAESIGTGLEENLPEEPFQPLLDNFDGVIEGIIDSASTMGDDASEAFEKIGKSSDEVSGAIYNAWLGNSVIPDLIAGFQDAEGEWATVATSLATNANTAAAAFQGLIDKQTNISKGFKTIKKNVDALVNSIRTLIGVFEELTVPEDFQGDSPPPVATWMTMAETATVGFAESVLFLGKSMEDLLSIGRSLSSAGGFFGKLYEERTLDPLEEKLKEIDEAIEEFGTPRTLFEAAQLFQLEKERSEVAAEYAAQQEKILALQKAQADLQFLEQQSKLLDLIAEHGLDAKDILGGLELGLGADVQGLMEAMTRAMQALVEQAEDELGIASDSKVFMQIGRHMMGGLAKGIQSTMLAPMAAATRAVTAPMMAGAGGSTYSVTMPITANINNGMDQAVFVAQVEQALTRVLHA